MQPNMLGVHCPTAGSWQTPRAYFDASLVAKTLVEPRCQQHTQRRDQAALARFDCNPSTALPPPWWSTCLLTNMASQHKLETPRTEPHQNRKHQPHQPHHSTVACSTPIVLYANLSTPGWQQYCTRTVQDMPQGRKVYLCNRCSGLRNPPTPSQHPLPTSDGPPNQQTSLTAPQNTYAQHTT
jgi:hypothetical protein